MKCLAVQRYRSRSWCDSQPKGTKGFLQDVQWGIPTFLKKKKLHNVVPMIAHFRKHRSRPHSVSTWKDWHVLLDKLVSVRKQSLRASLIQLIKWVAEKPFCLLVWKTWRVEEQSEMWHRPNEMSPGSTGVCWKNAHVFCFQPPYALRLFVFAFMSGSVRRLCD